MRNYHALSAVGLIALSGCGASTAGFGGVSWAGFNNTLTDIQAADDALMETPVLPAGGAPSYEGLFLMAPDGIDTYEVHAGRAELTANFDAGTITGDVTNFLVGDFDSVEEELVGIGTPVAGSLDISAPALDTDPFEITVSGSVAVGGADTPVNGVLQAQFKGDDAELLIGQGSDSVGVGFENWNAALAVQQP